MWPFKLTRDLYVQGTETRITLVSDCRLLELNVFLIHSVCENLLLKGAIAFHKERRHTSDDRIWSV